ncbi:MAG: putative colanic acid biosynthesis acetyltransferase WcaF, partial [Solirubrobacterales bacterium]|nr:putative colanic acid biosynthesis acetyltransferase WcaF [Solirubrobacterales bacterium]
DLSLTSNRDYHPGRPYWVRALWLLVETATLLNPLFVPYRPKARILRLFGARTGRNVVIKPGLHVKHPWRLTVGDNAWLGERAWIDNLAPVAIGANAVISQGAYLCTGNHDWADPGMGLVVKPITVGDGAWIGAFAKIGPGVTVGEEAIVTLGSVLLRDARPRGIYRGNPAEWVRERTVRDVPGPAAGIDERPFPTIPASG